MFRMKSTPIVVAMFTAASLHQGALAERIDLDVALANPTLLAGSQHTTFLKVGLTGHMTRSAAHRPAINVALVLDRSGSMTGSKIEQARAAAIRAIGELDSNDIVSVVTFDTTVQVVVPATKLTDKELVRQAIRQIQPGGSTSLFGGVSKGIAEVRKFLDRNHVNRVILLSDGLANSGPSSPGDFEKLGRSLIKEGIAVTTLGLGLDYNEDLMVGLARASDGNHAFVEDASALARVFNFEIRDALLVVAQDINVTIRCAPGVHPVRLLGVEGEINGKEVTAQFNQVRDGQEKYVLLEVAVPETSAENVRPVADVEVTYDDIENRISGRLARTVKVDFDSSSAVVQARVNAKVMAECVLQLANERNRLAVALRDAGRTDEARATLESNSAYLRDNAVTLQSDKLEQRAKDNVAQRENLDETRWQQTRKGMVEQQHIDGQQQAWTRERAPK